MCRISGLKDRSYLTDPKEEYNMAAEAIWLLPAGDIQEDRGVSENLRSGTTNQLGDTGPIQVSQKIKVTMKTTGSGLDS